jgi:hypothetical protein
MAHAALLVSCPAGFVVLWDVRPAAFGSWAGGGGFLVHALLFALPASFSALFVPSLVVLSVTVVFRSSCVALGVSGSSFIASALVFVFLRKTLTFGPTTSLVARCTFRIFCKYALSSFTALCAAGFTGSGIFSIGHTAVWVGLAVGGPLRAVQSSVLTAQALGRIVVVCRASFATGSIVVALVSTTLAFLRVRLASAGKCTEDTTNKTPLPDRIATLHRGRPVDESDVIRPGSDSGFVSRGVDHDRLFIAECS